MSLDIKRRLALLERAQEAEVAAHATGAVLLLPDNHREDASAQGPRVRLFDLERLVAARDGGASEHVALELAMIDPERL